MFKVPPFQRIWIKLRKKKLLVFFIIAFFMILLISYGFKDKILGIGNNIVDKINEKTGISIGRIIYDFEDKINIFREKKDLWKGDLPIFEFKVSQKDIKHFDELTEKSLEKGYLDEKENTWRKIELRYKNKVYDAEIKIHGESSAHWKSSLKSFNVKILNNESINNFKKFSLIMIEERTIKGRILKILSNDFGLFNIRDDFVVVKINGVKQGMYYLLEKLDNDFLEHNKCSSCVVVRIKDSKYKDRAQNPYGLDYGDSGNHITQFDFEISHAYLERSDLDLKKVFNALDNLFDAVKKEDSSMLISYFDIDNVVDFEAIRMLIGGGNVDGDNLRMAYSASNSKFYLIPWEGVIYPLEIKRGGFEYGLNRFISKYIPEEENAEVERKLFILFNMNDQIRQLKYKRIYKYISNKGKYFLERIDGLINEYLPYANSHKGGMFGTKVLEEKFKITKEIYKKNINLIRDALEYATCYVNIMEKDNKIILEVIPDSISQLIFEDFKINLDEVYSGNIVLKNKDRSNIINIEEGKSIDLTGLFKNIYFMTGLDEEMGTEKRVYSIEIIFSNTDKISIEDINLKIKNDISGKLLKDDEIYLEIANANDFYDTLSIEEFLRDYNDFYWKYENNELSLLEGDYVLKRDMIIPENLNFNIEAGVQVLIEEEKSIVAYSPVNIKGTKDKPVIIKAIDGKKPFGTFGIVGRNGNKKSSIDWLRLSEGNEKFINGVYFSGGLSIYHMDIDIKNTIISDCYADDGLNIKYGNILIEDSKFSNNFVDQVDLDFVEGVIKNSEFKNIVENNNGDGLDFSGSKVLIKNNVFSGLGDKGVSIGEETNIVLYENIIKNNNLGSAVKDSSNAFFFKNLFEKNKIGVSAYKKKLIYQKGGTFYLYENKYEGNGESFMLDEESEKKEFILEDYNFIEDYILNENLDKLFENLK